MVRLPAPFVPHCASLGPPRQHESSPQLPVSAPPTGLDKCLFFYLLGVGLPCHSILCQFWLCEEVQCVYLHHLLRFCSLKHLRIESHSPWKLGYVNENNSKTSLIKQVEGKNEAIRKVRSQQLQRVRRKMAVRNSGSQCLRISLSDHGLGPQLCLVC